MKYTAIRKTGEEIKSVYANFKHEAKNKFYAQLPLLDYGKDYKIITKFQI